jgi:hypothetical protein
MATATRVTGNTEGDGDKSDGDNEKGCGRATAPAPKRAVAAATRAAGDEEGDGEGGESDGDAYEESLSHLSHAIDVVVIIPSLPS